MDKKNKILIVTYAGIFLLLFLPVVTLFAQTPLVPPCDVECGFDDLVLLIKNIMNFLILIAAPVAAMLFAYAGILLFTSQGKPSQIEKAKNIFATVAIGFIIILAAWFVVKIIVDVLVKPEFSLLEKVE